LVAKFCPECGAHFAIACPSCGSELPAGAKFCLECGQPVARRANELDPPPRDYTPRHLADRILQSKSALEGERKQVSVMFADVKGSMELAEGMDPEEWHAILDQFFQVLTDVVHRFEGTVNQYLGDGIMALFGAPLAHEDHAQRACWAALSIRDEVRALADRLRVERGLNFGVRIGLNSGAVVVGKIGDDLRMDYTAQGHTVGLAQRMEQLAESGGICLSEHTAKLAEGYFQLRALGAAKIKGASEQLGIYALEGVGEARTRLDRSGAYGLSRFVGRTSEMATLETALERTLGGHGQVLGVVGEAGVGKSRLCAEFVAACRAKGLTVDTAHCPAHGRNVPYLPLLELLRSVFGIGDRDSDHESRRKIAGELALLGGELEDCLPLVLELLGVIDPSRPPTPEMSAEARKKRLFAFVRSLIRARSEREPSVLLVDDVHWIDPGSDEFLAQSVEAAAGTRTLILLNFRPEYTAPWTARSWYQQLPLVPLGHEEIRELLGDLMGNDPSLIDLASRIAERTGGNPFFAEEVVRSLAEAGHLAGERGRYRLERAVGEIEIPGNVQPVLAARIDRLGEREKQVLQTASVIGKRFEQQVLEGVVELAEPELSAALSALEAAEFVFATALYPSAEYEFKHPLTQEVALGSQLADRQRAIHRRVARALMDIHAGRHDEVAALIAQHLDTAAVAAEAAEWHGRAARWAASKDHGEAARHWARVCELAEPVTQRDLAVEARAELLKGSFVLGLRPGDARTLYREGVELAAGHTPSLARLGSWYARAIGSYGDVREYHRLSREALEIAKTTDDAAALADGWTLFTDSHFYAGDWQGALTANEEGLARFASSDAPFRQTAISMRYNYHGFRFLSLPHLGRWKEAQEVRERCLQIAQVEGPDASCFAHATAVRAAELEGDAAAALAGAQRCTEFCEASGAPPGYRAIATRTLALALLTARRWAEAADAAREAVRVRDEVGFEDWEGAMAYVYLAEALLGTGDRAGARDAAGVAYEHAHTRYYRYVEIRALRALALSRAHLEGPDAEGIDALLDAADTLVERTGTKPMAPRILEARAELAALRGDRDRERTCRVEARRLYNAMGNSMPGP
jgi:class 3 adenylate cyclase/tetratricopeptide (TPR) repeat protein